MAVKTSLRDSKPRSSGDGGEGMYSKDRRRVSVGKVRSSGNGDENVESEEKRGKRSVKGKSIRTERRDPSSRNERAGFRNGGEMKDRKPRNGKGRSSGNGDENLDSEEKRGQRSVKGKSSHTDRKNPSGRIERAGFDNAEGVKDRTPRTGRVSIGDSNDRRKVSVGKGVRSFGNSDEKMNSNYQRGRKSMEGHSSRTEKRDLSNRNERTNIDVGGEIKVRGGKQGMKSRGKDRKKDMANDGNQEVQSENVSTKRKRVYADQTLGNVETTNRNCMVKLVKKEVKKRLSTEKRMGKDEFEELGPESSLAVKKKYKGSEVGDKGTSLAENTKKSANKKVKGKQVAGNDNAEDAPRKNKRIRIDPYDMSNKRMDDGLTTTKDGEEKKKDLPKSSKNVELSLNAQFRAICPSESILSYIEDNLLGRRRQIEIKRAGYNIDLSAPLDNVPFSKSAERERIEEPAFRNKLEFFAAANKSSSFPPLELPEIAFAGRSNVGKSSMLNALTRQWGVVRTSDKPGLTQTINFFNLGSKLCLVDLPGYGFAYAKEEKKEAWEELVKEYVSTRVGLKRVCLLVDTKWGMKKTDYELIDLMERSKTKYQIVLTKTDMVFPIDVARRAMQIEESLKGNKSAVQPAMMVSSKSGAGIRSFRTALSKIARFMKP